LLVTVIVAGVVLFSVVDWYRDGLTTITEFRYGTSIFNPSVLDSDADGLEDWDEINYYQTNLLEPDTDDDGLPDGPEVTILGSNPLRMDIFVEVDWMSTTLEPSAISRLIKEFADAPIENPNGSTGITLHIDLDEQVPTVDEISPNHKSGDWNDFWDYKEYYFSQREGFHYALICEVVKSNGKILGGYAPGYDFMVGTFRPDLFDGYYYPPDVIGAIFMHELGHAIGLHSSVYEGIDSYQVPFSDYRSVMNYNTPRVPTDTDNAFYGYSNEGEFSDWNYLHEHGLETPAWDVVDPVWTGTAVFSLVDQYTVNVNEILDLQIGSKLVVKFYTYGDVFENESVIETFTPPSHVEENESVRHPTKCVKKVRLDLTHDDTENVISTIASYTVRKIDLETRFMEIPLEWVMSPPDNRIIVEQEFLDLPYQWAIAPS